ncbi:hypothetical protein EV421DRAFT_1500033 [Armillaria borealis]|uniref:Uncharacterized protein n=1 Tax=Armillaria borealis TaxID=47425 RepID=A0AA39IZP1_9AGAR|nr:hypothetical protein EV421DRAFT_1500033 [Armillaria borealis]
MKNVEAAAGDSVKGDIQEQDCQEFKDARKFVSGQYTKDTAKVKTLGTDPGIIFVPAPNSVPQDQPLNSAPILALAPAPASPPAADPDVVANINRRLDALIGTIKDMTKDNNTLKDEVATLKDKVAASEKLSREQDAEITILKDKVAALENLSEEQDAAYEDIHGWLVTNDIKYMDHLRLRHILNLGQARLARFANLPIDPAQSQSAGALSRVWRAHLAGCADNNDRLQTARQLLIACPDVETTSMSDGLLRLFTEYPSDIRRGSHCAPCTGDSNDIQ